MLNLNRSQLFPALVISFFSSSQLQSKSTTDDGEPKLSGPNILIIYTDQQRYNTIRALGNEYIQTPNLDRLVKEGVAFTNSFVSSPVSTPSRWSLHTGMYTTSHQTYSNHHVAKRPMTSLPLELKKKGYQTAVIGKNHCFLNKTDLDVIIESPGFKGQPEDGRSALKAMPWSVQNDPMHALTDSTLKILGQNKKKKPFFIWLSYLYPHTPYRVPEPYFSMYNSVEIPEPVCEQADLEYAKKPFRQVFHQENNDRLLPYDSDRIKRMKQNYYGMISFIDSEIGRILDYLDKNKLRDNTLIIFTADHGDYMGDHHMFTKSPAMYDCLVRVPLIFSWTGKIPSNIVTEELISNVDIMPTILTMLESDIPDQVQGISYAEFLTGDNFSKQLRSYVFSEYGIPGKPIDRIVLKKFIPDYKKNPVSFSDPRIPWEANPVVLSGRFRMIRSKEWKFIEEENGISELYDLKNDPGELVNLWNNPDYTLIQDKLYSALKEWKSGLPGIEKDSIDMGIQNLKEYTEFRKKGLDPAGMYR
jgi:arylsulfatase A-like enzyme